MGTMYKQYCLMGVVAAASLTLMGQAKAQTASGSVLSFQPENSNVRFEINLKRVIAPTVDDQTVLNGPDLGEIAIQSDLGSAQRINGYRWTVSPTSRLYLSPSGYKSLIAKYQYSQGGESHALNISCQTRGIKPNKATCKLFGDGPLLNGETKAIGRLSINEAVADNGFNSGFDNGFNNGFNGSASSSSASGAYRRGYELGLLDAKQKLDRNYKRHRTEYDGSEEMDFGRGYANAYGNISGTGGAGDNASGGYMGKGALSLYPTKTRPQEQRYDLTRVVLKTGANATGRLTLFTNTSGKTVEMQGKLETASGGQTFDISAVDGIPAQGKLLIGSNGLVRVTTPILVGSEDQEVSLYFRPN